MPVMTIPLCPIEAARSASLAEAAGFRLSPAGQFEYLQEETGTVLCSPEPSQRINDAM